MNLDELNSGHVFTKPWLNPVVNNLSCTTLNATGLNVDAGLTVGQLTSKNPKLLFQPSPTVVLPSASWILSAANGAYSNSSTSIDLINLGQNPIQNPSQSIVPTACLYSGATFQFCCKGDARTLAQSEANTNRFILALSNIELLSVDWTFNNRIDANPIEYSYTATFDIQINSYDPVTKIIEATGVGNVQILNQTSGVTQYKQSQFQTSWSVDPLYSGLQFNFLAQPSTALLVDWRRFYLCHRQLA